MASSAMDNRILCNSSLPELAKYFKQVLERASNASITDQLLAGLTTDALPERVLGVWIAAFADAQSIVKALNYEESAGVRRKAIKRFPKCLRNEATTHALWDAVGGTAGLLILFSELSVHDVQSFCQALGRTSTFNAGRETRQHLLAEFCMSLCSDYFPQAKFQSPETRPLTRFYSNIVPACTEEFVRAWDAVDGLPRAGGRWMDHAHHRYVRERCLRQARDDNGKKFQVTRFQNLLRELPPVLATNYMSESMQFSLDFLDYLAQHDYLQIPVGTINSEIVVPLIRRIIRRRTPLDVRAKVLDSVVRALRPRMTDGQTLELGPLGLLQNALRVWNRSEQGYERLLIDVLHLVPDTQKISLDMIGSLLLVVREQYRSRLLTLLLGDLRPFSAGLERDEDIKDLGPWPTHIFAVLPSAQAYTLLLRLVRLRLREKWKGEIFTSMLTQHATQLLEELLRLRPAGDFIDWTSLRSSNAMWDIRHNQSVGVLQLYVAPESAKRKAGWKDVIEERKKEATRSREQHARATWARSAILCSIASGSLEVYEDTLLWARRFNRDALTAKELYNTHTVQTTAGIALLSGIQTGLLVVSDTADSIKQNVMHGNRIMLLLLETAFQSQGEPSFQFYDWFAVLELFNKVVAFRLAQVDDIQDVLGLAHAQMYETVWQDTLDTLVLAEERCLKDDNEKLKAQASRGILGRTTPPLINSIKPSKCSFVDQLARHRDDLWGRHRRSKDPNVVSLQPPWPKGLPFQESLSVTFRDEDFGYAGRLPYLEARAEAIVFPNPEKALQTDPVDVEARQAISTYVDGYKVALDFYINAGINKADQQRRSELAWKHATGPLSKPRGMSHAQAYHFWIKYFHDAPGHSLQAASDHVPNRPDPTLPIVEDPEKPTEWNPDPDPEQFTVQSQKLQVTCLDYTLQSVQFADEGWRVLKKIEEVLTYNHKPKAFWDENPLREAEFVTPVAREGLVGLALLLINTYYCPNRRRLSTAFPSANDARFPALFLDEEFLERPGIHGMTGLRILERLARDAPLTLVAELCETMLENYGQPDGARRGYADATLRLLKILVKGYRPSLALESVSRVVIDMPDVSSWHRHMLTKGLFNRLKAEQARGFLWKLALSIKTKLQEQAQRKPAVDREDYKPCPPIIKVTTVTALAQLLADTKFVSGDETVDILCDIFLNARHPDIRVAIIQSLVSIAMKARHTTVTTRILDALKRYAVPVASSLNERSPMTEEDWQRAEAALEVPEVNEPALKDLQPVLSAIVDAYGSLPRETATQLYRRVLLPIFDASAANNRRWTRLFLRKHNLFHECDADTLPLVPPKPAFLYDLTKRDVQDRRSEIFTLWGEAVMTNLVLPHHVSVVNSAISNDNSLRTSNGGKHWLSLWNNPGLTALSWSTAPLHTLLTTPMRGKTDSVPIPLLQDLVYQQADVMIMRSDERFSETSFLLNPLQRPGRNGELAETTWERNVRPLLQRIVDRIESLRTPEWQRNPDRVPVALPDTFELRLRLLPRPAYLPEPRQRPGHAADVDAFGTAFLDLVRELARSPQPYHARLHHLHDATSAVHPADYFRLALRLGPVPPSAAPTLAEYLCVEMVEGLLGRAERCDRRDVSSRVGDMVAAWKGSADETIRNAGLRVVRTWEAQREGRMKWFWEGGRTWRNGTSDA